MNVRFVRGHYLSLFQLIFYFKKKFLQRLKWFTAVKLHNQAALQEKFTAQEMQSNERKLVQTGLIIDPNQADGGKSSHGTFSRDLFSSICVNHSFFV